MAVAALRVGREWGTRMTEPPEGLRPQSHHPKATSSATATPSSTLTRICNRSDRIGALTRAGTRKRPGLTAGAFADSVVIGSGAGGDRRLAATAHEDRHAARSEQTEGQ